MTSHIRDIYQLTVPATTFARAKTSTFDPQLMSSESPSITQGSPQSDFSSNGLGLWYRECSHLADRFGKAKAEGQ
ncbi:hypothetical protein FRC12_021898 [Ceratobasidium sp. 428]|nr:hypothetical protein FRC12_021898 [Ceratobasidium sp. 428]